MSGWTGEVQTGSRQAQGWFLDMKHHLIATSVEDVLSSGDCAESEDVYRRWRKVMEGVGRRGREKGVGGITGSSHPKI